MGIEKLKELAEVDILTVQRETLVDIRDVKIDAKKCQEERIADYLRQIKNPYCFKCNGIIVKSRFSDKEESETLEDKLTEYFTSL